MANTRNANTFFVDTAAADAAPATTGNLALPNLKVLYMLVSIDGANPRLTLRDVSTSAVKFDIDLGTPDSPTYYDFSRKPVVFPNGINPSTVDSCRVTLVIEESRG